MRLTCFGELDLTVADQLQARLEQLKAQDAAVCLDLSELSFIDSSGIRVVTGCRLDSDRSGWTFQDRPTSTGLKRPLEWLLGLGDVLWSKTLISLANLAALRRASARGNA